MNRQQVLDTLDSIAASLSALAAEVNKVYLYLGMTPETTAPAATETTTPKKTYTRKKWSEEDSATARKMALQGHSPEKIAEAINRPGRGGAVRAHLNKVLSSGDYETWIGVVGQRSVSA